MNGLNKLGKAITKIFEVFHWIGAFGMMIVGVIMTSKYASKIRECKMRVLHKLK